jgi:hypothetical protein
LSNTLHDLGLTDIWHPDEEQMDDQTEMEYLRSEIKEYRRQRTEFCDVITKLMIAMARPTDYVLSPTYIEGAIEWCEMNTTGEWEILMNHEAYGCLVLFANSRDSSLFKLFTL